MSQGMGSMDFQLFWYIGWMQCGRLCACGYTCSSKKIYSYSFNTANISPTLCTLKATKDKEGDCVFWKRLCRFPLIRLYPNLGVRLAHGSLGLHLRLWKHLQRRKHGTNPTSRWSAVQVARACGELKWHEPFRSLSTLWMSRSLHCHAKSHIHIRWTQRT